MCGIVFAGSNTMSLRDVDFFESLLYCDIVRGDHSTGVYAGFSHVAAEPLEVRIRKAAVPADVFIRTPKLWGEVKEDRRPSTYNANAFITKNPKFLVGHNRYATMGEIIDANAHPFQHGSITLVHNGTLDDQSLLPDSEKFKVDSENVAYSIDKIGIEETIKKLNGKFTLVWFDAKDQTLNFLRNKDRPFHFMETSSGDWFGASEEDMLMWLSKRTKGPTAKRHFEAEIGTQYVFDVSNGGFKFKEERKHELPVFPYRYANSWNSRSGGGTLWDYDDDREWERYYSNRGYSSQSSNGTTRSTGSGNQTQNSTKTTEETTKDRLNNMLSEAGVSPRLGENIFFETFQSEPYPNRSGKGKITGYLANKSEYIEVQAPGVDIENFQEGTEYVGKILSCYILNYMLHIVVGNARPRQAADVVTISDLVLRITETTDIPTVTPEDIDADLEDESVMTVTADGSVISKEDWESNGKYNTCANCGSPILWEDSEDATIENGFAYCSDCNPSEEKSSGQFQFTCRVCNNTMHEDLESSTNGVCVMCNAQRAFEDSLKSEVKLLPAVVPTKPREILKIRSLLTNGMRVTREQWFKMNNCWFCKQDIPWEDAETAMFMGGRTVCDCCDTELKNNRVP